MTEKSASITIMYKVAVYAPAERADTLPVFHLYPAYMYSVLLPLALPRFSVGFQRSAKHLGSV
jgi:hypothetical protein